MVVTLIIPPAPTPLRYFALSDLRDLFSVTPEGLNSSQTQRQLHDLHADQRQHGPGLTRHLEWLQSVEGFAGVCVCVWRKCACVLQSPAGRMRPLPANQGTARGEEEGGRINGTRMEGDTGLVQLLLDSGV